MFSSAAAAGGGAVMPGVSLRCLCPTSQSLTCSNPGQVVKSGQGSGGCLGGCRWVEWVYHRSCSHQPRISSCYGSAGDADNIQELKEVRLVLDAPLQLALGKSLSGLLATSGKGACNAVRSLIPLPLCDMSLNFV